METKIWKWAYWTLLVGWMIGLVLFMFKIKSGIFNSYLSDLAFPPWFYINIRGLDREDKQPRSAPFIGPWFGLSAYRAAISIFLVGAFSEIVSYYWPRNTTFDLKDIGAYAIGLIICMTLDLRYTN